jgi:polyhydroxybutyrate depolymerase
MLPKLFFPLLTAVLSIHAMAQQDISGRVEVGGKSREYIIHLPMGYSGEKPLPAVFVFHGGGGNSKQVCGYFGMDPIADREGFITVYPNGIGKQWNDGREFRESISANDDVRFIDQLMDTLLAEYAVDSGRVFATGISNGGFFSIYLSFRLTTRFLAVAPVCANIPLRLFPQFFPSGPISVLLINGVADPIVPYNGGTIGNWLMGKRGECVSTDSTIKRFCRIDRLDGKPVIEKLADQHRNDGCTATRYDYTGGQDNSRVTLVKIDGGGHTLPGAKPYLPRILGNVCKDFSGSEMIWKFFKECRPRAQ